LTDLERVVAECGDEAEGAAVDVADGEAMIRLCARIARQRGRLDVAVGAAGTIDGGQPIWRTSLSSAEELFRVNAMGAWNTARAAIPYLLASPRPELARLVIVTSAAAQRGLFHLPAYTVAKHAALGVVRAAAADLTGTGVAAVAVSPGCTETPMLHATAELYGCDTSELLSHQALRRPISPEEVARAVLFAVSPDGAALTGSILAVEGGFGG
jgi:NAD(P)-dependent dehydrogenase (short-subunit alcohol dehydrogenase family)